MYVGVCLPAPAWEPPAPRRARPPRARRTGPRRLGRGRRPGAGDAEGLRRAVAPVRALVRGAGDHGSRGPAGGGRRLPRRARRAVEAGHGPERGGRDHVAGDADCDASGAICTGDGRPLSHSLSATVAGPVGISIADARVEEAAGALLAFTVTLSRAASGTLSVDYATADGSAQAGVDYTAASGTLTFDAGKSSTTIEVAVLDDAHDEGKRDVHADALQPVCRAADRQ